MFSGGFAEGRDRQQPGSLVRSVFSGAALTEIILYALGEDSRTLRSGATAVLAEIAEAAEYYAVDGLREEADRALAERASDPSDACATLQAVWDRWEVDGFGCGSAGAVARTALSSIEKAYGAAMPNCAILGEGAMKLVLDSKAIAADEASLFGSLQQWVSADEEKRRPALERLVPCISFDLMPPSFLRDVVLKSGLVPTKTLSDAFQEIAICAERKHGFTAQQRLPILAWCSSSSSAYSCQRSRYGVELLNRSMNTGCWIWDLRVMIYCNFFWVGVTSGDVNADEWLGKQKHGYAYGSNGAACHATGQTNGPYTCNGPTFGENDMLRLKLDCDRGTIHITVNGGLEYEAFTGMKKPNIAYRPAVSIKRPGCIHIIKCEQVSL